MDIVKALKNEVVEVAPHQTVFNSRILSHLKSPAPVPPARPSFTVPLYKSVDVGKLVKNNDSRIRHNAAASTSRTSQILADTVVANEDEDTMNDDPQYHVEISQILPLNRAEQLSILLIRYFPNVRKHLVELILDTLLGQNAHHNLYTWSSTSSEFLEHTNLFVKFKSLAVLKWFYVEYCDSISTILNSDNCSFLGDDSLEAHFNSIRASDFEIDLSQADSVLRRILDNPHSFESSSSHKGTEDLDKVMSFYKDYKVDNNELIDVPGSMKENIVREIIVFRSKMLSLERENRKQEIELERVKTRERLKKVFEELRETHMEDAKTLLPESSDNESDLNSENEFEELDEQEYQEYLDMMKAEATEKEYQSRLERITKKEDAERGPLVARLAQLQEYDDHLIDNKLQYIDQAKLAADFISGGAESEVANLPRDSLLRLYFSDHLRYVDLRDAQRSFEAKRDDLDRAAELEERSRNLKTYIESSASPVFDLQVPPLSINRGKIIKELNSAQSDELQQKINNLVAEYLGIHDDFLLEVINTNLMTHNLDGKEELIADLTEVLDDDAKSLVDDLWLFISNLQ